MYVKPEAAITVFELLMMSGVSLFELLIMSGVSLETC
jgi:hypothetical protein